MGATFTWLWVLLTLLCSPLLLSLSSCTVWMIGRVFLNGARLHACGAGARRAARGSPRAAWATGGSLGQRAGGAPRQHARGGGGKVVYSWVMHRVTFLSKMHFETQVIIWACFSA